MQSILSTVFWLLVPVAAMLFAFFVIREGTKEDPPAAPDSPHRPEPTAAAPMLKPSDAESGQAERKAA